MSKFDHTIGEDGGAEGMLEGPGLDWIVPFWNEVWHEDDFSATTRGALEDLERQVTEALYSNPPDLEEAESITAYAMLLISGQADH